MFYTIIYTISSIIAVIFVFLFAVEKFSNQIQKLAGDKFKSIIQRITSTPFKGTLIGTVVTAIMQSSTATTVMAISLVQSGIMPFTNSLGVIFGANIGTTITTQLIAFQLLEIAPFILVVGFILMKIKNRYSYLGKPIFYFGLIFSSLFIISVLVEPLKDNAILLDLLAKSSGVMLSIIVGFVVVAILQSSALVTGIVVIMSGAGLMGFEQAFAIILGANVGTTTTGLIAATVMEKGAKRAAMAHFVFNLLGVILILPFIDHFTNMIMLLPGNIEIQVASAHFIFNVLSAVLGLLFVKQFEGLIVRLVR